MFMLINGKVILQPFKVIYTQMINNIVEEGYFTPEKYEWVEPVVESKEVKKYCYFTDREQAAVYAEGVNGEVVDSTPNAEVVSVLDSMTFTSEEEVRNFLQNGIEPAPKMTLENLTEVVADIIGGRV